jgi:hypothetical protein
MNNFNLIMFTHQDDVHILKLIDISDNIVKQMFLLLVVSQECE